MCGWVGQANLSKAFFLAPLKCPCGKSAPNAQREHINSSFDKPTFKGSMLPNLQRVVWQRRWGQNSLKCYVTLKCLFSSMRERVSCRWAIWLPTVAVAFVVLVAAGSSSSSMSTTHNWLTLQSPTIPQLNRPIPTRNVHWCSVVKCHHQTPLNTMPGLDGESSLRLGKDPSNMVQREEHVAKVDGWYPFKALSAMVFLSVAMGWRLRCNSRRPQVPTQTAMGPQAQSAVPRRDLLLLSPLALGHAWGLGPAAMAQDLQRDYDSFAAGYDALDGGPVADALGLVEARRRLLAGVRGRVLEVGVGTGLNLPLYPWEQVTQFTGIDLSPGMLREAAQKQKALRLGGAAHVTLKPMDVGALAFENETFDSVVDTFSLCVFEEPLKALKEMHRVCAPGASLLLLENSRSPNAFVAAYQDLTADAAAAAGGKGCRYNQDVEALVRAAGFKILRSDPVGGGFFRLIEATRDTV